MILDGNSIETDSKLSADVCIIGAGAAGLTIAHTLDNTDLKIIILESGGMRFRRVNQSLNDGCSNDAAYPFHFSRVRQFGGTTTRWTGVCVPLDKADFEKRNWFPFSGWPLSYAELQPYYGLARPIFGMPPQSSPPHSPFAEPPMVVKPLFYSRPLDLGRKFRQQIKRSTNITTILHTTVTNLNLDEAGKRIDSIDAMTMAGSHFRLKARTIVLAAGGIENPRLLLTSNKQHPNGIGNRHDVVGRYHMEHPMQSVAILPISHFATQTRYFTNFSKTRESRTLGTFGLGRAVREKEQLLDVHFRLYRYNLLEDSEPVIAAKAIAQGRSSGANWRAALPHWHTTLLPYLRWHLWNKLNEKASFDYVRLHAIAEQAPHPDNRITLAVARDRFGNRLPHLQYDLGDTIRKNVRRTLKIVGQLLHGRGFGRMRLDDIAHLAAYDQYGLHPMGATRMSHDPRFGVVNADCCVHGVANLYIAGSSVFPTSGAANPTFTIVALAIRLAEHLRSNLVK